METIQKDSDALKCILVPVFLYVFEYLLGVNQLKSAYPVARCRLKQLLRDLAAGD